MTALARDQVADVYRQGVTAVQTMGGRFEPGDWERLACGHWTGTDTARHLLAVARWYHAWLDRALAGDSSRAFDGSDIDAHNEEALATLDGMPGEQAIAEFTDASLSYLERAEANWDVPFGYPFGVVTIGLHCGAAASDWHLHAWDLSGGLTGAVVRRLVPVGSRLSPWRTMLKRSGRQPTGGD